MTDIPVIMYIACRDTPSDVEANSSANAPTSSNTPDQMLKLNLCLQKAEIFLVTTISPIIAAIIPAMIAASVNSSMCTPHPFRLCYVSAKFLIMPHTLQLPRSTELSSTGTPLS